MKALFFIGLFSFSAFAETRVVTKTFSFTETEKSFSSVFADGQTVKIEYKVTDLPKPVLNDSLLKVEKDMKCISWSYPGTSPDDPGVCGEYAWTGKYRVFAPYNPIDLFSVTEVVTDLSTGIKSTRELPTLKTSFYIQGGEVLIDTPEVPANLNLKFVNYVSGDPFFGCAVEGYKTGPILDVPANLGICTSTVGQVSLERVNGEYKFTASKKVTFKTTITAFWMVRDFPRNDYVRKDIWEDGEWASTAFDLK